MSGAAHVTIVISALTAGGAQRVAASLAGHWARTRPVSVVTLWPAETDVHPLPPAVRRIALDLGHPSRTRAEGLVRAAGRVRALRAALRALRPGLVVSFLDRTNVLSLLAAAGTGIPVLACERSDPRMERPGLPWAALRRLLYPRARAVVVQTESVAAWARRRFPRVEVVPNLVERPALAADPGASRGPLGLVALGRLAPEKGFDLLVEAFARVAGRHPAWSLSILGEGPERLALEELVRRLGLEGRVALPGRVADPVPALAAAHAFALPSRREGFPNALLEAMAVGLPAVAFDCPSGPAEIVRHGEDGLLVHPGDVGEMAAALDRLLGSPQERARLGRAARRVCETYAPERILRRWSELLDGKEHGRC